MQTEDDFREAAVRLIGLDPSLAAVVERHALPAYWHREPGFATLLLLILEQQVSLPSAAAAFRRLAELIGPPGPERLLELADEDLRSAGFSRQKARYGRELARAVLDGSLDLDGLTALADEEVRASLVSVPGIGPWTADVYLLSCLRRPDVWPVGDRALQVSAAEVLGLAVVPDPGTLVELGERWRPDRSTAARLLWHSYLARRGR